MKAALNEVAPVVETLVKPSLLYALGSVGDYGLDVSNLQAVNKLIGVVGCICQTESARDMVEELPSDGSLMGLSRREMDVQRATIAVGDQVYFCRESAPGSAYRVFFGPPRPPLAS